jgi:hypothetical protein
MKRTTKKVRTKAKSKNPKRSAMAILTRIPPGFLEDLPIEDRDAISEIVGKPVSLRGYDELGRAELRFRDKAGVLHFIWVDPEFMTTV